MVDFYLFLFLIFALNKFIVRLILEFIIPSQLFNSFSKRMYELSKLRAVMGTLCYLIAHKSVWAMF
jgi:hypothetical protein